MIAVQVGGLDDQRVTVVSQDNAVDRCRFANRAHVPGGGERRKLLYIVPSKQQKDDNRSYIVSNLKSLHAWWGGAIITDTRMGIKAKLRPGFPFATGKKHLWPELAAMTFQGSVFAPHREGDEMETVILCLTPKLLEDGRVVVDVAHLDGDSGAGLHPGHAQCTHHQKVGRGLLQKKKNQKSPFSLTLNLEFIDIPDDTGKFCTSNLKVESFACVNDAGVMVDVEREVLVAPGDIVKER